MKKSILALLLAVLMVASLLPAAAMADGEVAEVGNAKYTSLQEAIDAATAENNEVVLIANTNENVTIAADKNIVLDLNGFTLNGGTTQSQAALTNNGIVVIKDSSAAGTGTIKREDDGTPSYYTVYNLGTMTFNGGNVYNNSGDGENGSSLVCNVGTSESNTATLIINDGYFKQQKFIAVKNDDFGVLEINGGTIVTQGTVGTLTSSSVQNWHKATINGGTIIGAIWTSVWNNNYPNATTTINDVDFTGTIIVGPYNGTITTTPALNIDGGNFTITATGITGTADVTVTDGTFNISVSEYAADTLKYEVKNADGTFTYYEKFDDALKAAGNGAVITGINEAAAETNYTLTIDPANGGEVKSVNAPSGSTFTLPTVSKSGCAFLGWSDGTSTYPAGTVITLTSNVTYTAIWVRHPDTPYVPEPEEPEEPEVPAFPFYDVPTSAWYYTAVKYVYDNKLMDGVDTYVFAPNDTLTRAMVWTIIARMSGVDTTGGNSWYAKAQEWVITNGISDGENPTAAITRQELVTMLYRYAQIKGYDVSVGESTNILSYVDATSISDYAVAAFQWSCGSGLTEGDENGALTPLATATRAQAAAMIMRFCESVK